MFEIVFPCARLNAPIVFKLPTPAISISGEITPGEIGKFQIILPKPATSLSGTVLHQPLNLILPKLKTSLTAQFNGGHFIIILPRPAISLSGKRGHAGTFAIIFNICSGNMMLYGARVTRPPLKAEFSEPADYCAGSPYTAWTVSDPQVNWTAG